MELLPLTMTARATTLAPATKRMRQESRRGPEPLTSVAALFATRGNGQQRHSVRERVGLLPHAVSSVSAFLDVAYAPRWTIPKACEHGHLAMLPRLASQEPVDMNEHYRAHLFSKGLVYAAQRGDLPMVQWLCCEYCPSGFAWKGMEEAAMAGQLSVLQWLVARYNEYMKWKPPLMDLAVKHGRLETMQWLHEHLDGVGCSYAAMRSAIKNNDVRTARWLLAHYPDRCEKISLWRALERGSVALAQLFHDNGYVLHAPLGLHAAASSGELEIVQWALDHSITSSMSSALNRAGMHGWVEMAQLIEANIHLGHEYDRDGWDGMRNAAVNGHLELAKWFRTLYPYLSVFSNYIDDAASNGHIASVEWMLATWPGVGCTTNAMDGAAQNNHLEMLKWLHAHQSEGCSARATVGAARNGHFDVLTWLNDVGLAQFSAECIDAAATHNHLHVVQWLHEYTTEGCTARAMDGAAQNNHLEMVQWLHEHRHEGCTTEAMDGAASLEMVQWLHTHRSEGCTHRAMDNAAKRGDMELVLWLHAHRREGCTRSAVCVAAGYHHFELFQWLCETYPELVNLEHMRRSHQLDEPMMALVEHMRAEHKTTDA